MRFDPLDPFPLLPEGAASYAEEKAHSAEADAWLGLRIRATEAALAFAPDAQERWERQGPGVFLTPYSELRRILAELGPRPGERVADLGAGYGRMGFVLDAHFPGVAFLGYELVPERVAEGARVLRERGCANAALERRDLWAQAPDAADYYFLYDYGARAAIEKTLADLRALARRRKVVLVGRGRAVRDAVERGHPWLGAVAPPRHRAHYSVYRSG